MCGFLFSCSLESIPNHCLSLLHLVSRRGPDDLRTIQRSIYSPRDNGSEQAKPLFHFSLAASVLSLRGETIVTQPVLDDPSASFLVWNGEAWRLESRAVSGNDTTLVFRTMLTKCTDSVAIHQSEAERGKAVAEAVRDVLQAIDGPFSFLFFHGPTGLVFYGRDSFGRRSLLVSQDQTGNFRISSVSAGPDPAPWREVETGGIFMLGVSSAFVGAALSSDEQNRPPNFKSQFIPWLLNEVCGPSQSLGVPFLKLTRMTSVLHQHSTVILASQHSPSVRQLPALWRALRNYFETLSEYGWTRPRRIALHTRFSSQGASIALYWHC